jgi:Stress responsive A/B Barrel Domain
MIRHVVLVRLRPDVPEAEIASIASGLAALTSRLGGFVACRFGPNVSFEGLDHGYRHGFVMEFTNAEAHRRYHDDEEHRRLGARLVVAASGGLDGILVFDLESS